MARVAIAREDTEAAAELCQRALVLAETREDRGELASTYYTLAAVYRLQAEYDQALKQGEVGLELFRLMGDRSSEALALYELSLIQEKQERYEAALAQCERSLELFRAVKEQSGIAHVLFQIGDLYWHLEQPEQAYRTWTEALAIAEAVNNTWMIKALNNRMESYGYGQAAKSGG